MPDNPDLAALVGSRICHDLISPLGAIGNGVELLAMTSATAGPELSLIADSVLAANARIRFYRVAFGAAPGDQRIGRPEVLSILADLTRGSRLAIDWQAAFDQSRADVKLAFLLIQCLESALPFGGRITIAAEAERWRLAGRAERLKVDAPLWAALHDGADRPAGERDLTPAQVQFGLAAEEARRRGRLLQTSIGPEEIRLSF